MAFNFLHITEQLVTLMHITQIASLVMYTPTESHSVFIWAVTGDITEPCK